MTDRPSLGFAALFLTVATTAVACGSESTGTSQGCPMPELPRAPTALSAGAGRPGTIATVVGTGEWGTNGVGGPAKKAQLQTPIDLAFDDAGNLYIAERFNHRIVKVDASGTLTVAAGGGQPGFSGDGGPAKKAELSEASGVAVDPDGNLYIADSGNNRIRMVGADGVITTIAGTGRSGFAGDGGPATKAALNAPAGMAFDAERNLYVGDLGNSRVRKIDQRGIITTIAELGSYDDHLPSGLGCDADGALNFTDLGNNHVRLIDAKGRLQTVAGTGEIGSTGDGGEAREAKLSQPLDLALDSEGNIYIAEHDHGGGTSQRVRMVDREGIITTVAGTGVTGYSGDGGPATLATMAIPAAVAIGPDGNLYIADADNDVIRMVVL